MKSMETIILCIFPILNLGCQHEVGSSVDGSPYLQNLSSYFVPNGLKLIRIAYTNVSEAFHLHLLKSCSCHMKLNPEMAHYRPTSRHITLSAVCFGACAFECGVKPWITRSYSIHMPSLVLICLKSWKLFDLKILRPAAGAASPVQTW